MMKIKYLSILILILGFSFGEATALTDLPSELEVKVLENDPDAVIAKYVQAIGGKEKMGKIKNSIMTMEADFQGTSIQIKGISDQENKRILQETTVMGNLAQKTLLVNGKGTMMSMGQQQEMNEEMIQMLEAQAYVFPELHYEELGYKLEHKGIEDVNGEEANALVITTENGMETMEYYSIDSGLKLRTSSSSTGEINFSDYQEVDGVMFPMTLTIKNPMLPTAMIGKVTSIKFNQELSDEDFK